MTFGCGPAARVIAAAAAIFLLRPSLDARPQPRVVVFAAASLANVLDELSAAVTNATGVRLVTSYAATSALARQIEAGAPASIFIAADLDWMEYLDTRGLIERSSRVNLVGNSLVLIAPAGPKVVLRVAPAFPLRAALGDGRLAIADPSAVPAGRYAEAALRSLDVWAKRRVENCTDGERARRACARRAGRVAVGRRVRHGRASGFARSGGRHLPGHESSADRLPRGAHEGSHAGGADGPDIPRGSSCQGRL